VLWSPRNSTSWQHRLLASCRIVRPPSDMVNGRSSQYGPWSEGLHTRRLVTLSAVSHNFNMEALHVPWPAFLGSYEWWSRLHVENSLSGFQEVMYWHVKSVVDNFANTWAVRYMSIKFFSDFCIPKIIEIGRRFLTELFIGLERGANLHTAQLMPLPLTVSCFSKIQNGLPLWSAAHPGSPGQRAVKWVHVCVCVCAFLRLSVQLLDARRGLTGL